MAAYRLTAFLETFSPDPNIRGAQWEVVCQWFLKNDPVYRTQLTDVWLWKEWPDRPYDDERGIDLVARARNGTLWAIQAKCYAPTRNVTKLESLEKWKWSIGSTTKSPGWESRFQELQTYAQTYGHVAVPASFRTASGFALQSWMTDQKKRYRTGNLEPERVRKLESVADWEWGTRRMGRPRKRDAETSS